MRNPDEFYHKMEKSVTRKGIHRTDDGGKKNNIEVDDLLEFRTQDIAYLTHKQQVDRRKVEKLKDSLHFLQEGPDRAGEHTIFFDDADQRGRFDPAEYFNTEPELVDRTFNRLSKEQLREGAVALSGPDGAGNGKGSGRSANGDRKALRKLEKGRAKKYLELAERCERDDAIQEQLVGLHAKKANMGKGNKFKKTDGEGKTQMVWKKERKK